MTTHSTATRLPDLAEEDVRALLAAFDDSESHHILYVTSDGVVHLTDDKRAALGPDVKFRYETYIRNNDYVGSKAAADAKYVAGLTAELIKDWTAGRTGYIDF